MARTVLGHEVRRVEDPTLLTGEARFLADLPADGLLHAVFVRSTIAHGVLEGVDTSGALTGSGVVAVLTARDFALGRQGADMGPLARPLLAVDRVRFVGEAVAVVVAESYAEAVDAAEQVVVAIDPRPAVLDPIEAAGPEAPLLFPEHGSNVVGGRHHEDADAFLAGGEADVVVRTRLVHQRIAPVTMEPNGALAVPEPDGSVTLWASTQGVFGVRSEACKMLGLAPEQLRVRAPWVGGGFGAKGGTYPEQILVVELARRLGRPVRWVETRTENLLGMTHGRAQIHDIAAAASRDGVLQALWIRGWAEVGAYPIRGGFIPMVTRFMSAGLYRWPRHDFSAQTVVTNATPTGPYRGAGRPEAAAIGERALDLLAAELGMDPAELRRRNFPSPDEFPFTTATGAIYDSGDYAKALDAALELADYPELRRQQVARRADPTVPLMGIGIGCYVETSGAGAEFGAVAVEDDGRVVVTSGSVPHGQGHETMWAQIASATLGVPFESVRVVHSDTGRVDHGTGTFGSRSLQLAGSAVLRASEEVLQQARSLAADLLEASPDDVILFDDGRIGVAGVPGSGQSWAELAAAAADRNQRLTHALDFEQTGSFPFGCHVAVVDIDRDTGQVTLRDMVAVDDCGNVINPLLAEGQVHGGLAQGIAQILFEEVRYDTDGNPLTVTLVDYAIPSAGDFPPFRTAHTVTPSPNNPLGAKGLGESGTTGSISAVWNAVCDALSPLGIRHLDPPFTPARVWEALQSRPT